MYSMSYILFLYTNCNGPYPLLAIPGATIPVSSQHRQITAAYEIKVSFSTPFVWSTYYRQR